MDEGKTMWNLFVNRGDCFMDARRGSWFCRRQALTTERLRCALAGKAPLGVYAVSGDGISRWCCLDTDEGSGAGALARLALRHPDAPLVFELSRRGAHLWWFVHPAPWQQVRAFGLSLATEAGLACEVFPKGGGLNGVRLPLTPHPKDGRVYPLLDPATGAVLDPAALLAIRPQAVPVVALPKSRMSVPEWVGERTEHSVLMAEVARYTKLRQMGQERAIGRCPFHDDARPSFSILGGYWRCWAGCGSGGLGAFRRLVREHKL